MDTYAAAAGECVEFSFNFLAAGFGPAENKVLLQTRLIVRRSRHCNVLLPKETMSLCVISGLDVGERKRYLLAIKDRDDPPNRTDEARALRPSPNHRPWPRNLANHFREHCAQNFDGRFAEN